MAEVLDGAPAPGKRRQSFFDTALKVESKAKARATAFAQKKRKERADALQAVEDSRKVKTTDIVFFSHGKERARGACRVSIEQQNELAVHSLVSSSPFLAACLHPNVMDRSSKKGERRKRGFMC